MLNQAIDQLPKRLTMIIRVNKVTLNFVWTNRVCKRSLLFPCLWSENSLIKMFVERYCQRSFMDSEHLCKLGKEYINTLLCKFYTFCYTKFANF